MYIFNQQYDSKFYYFLIFIISYNQSCVKLSKFKVSCKFPHGGSTFSRKNTRFAIHVYTIFCIYICIITNQTIILRSSTATASSNAFFFRKRPFVKTNGSDNEIVSFLCYLSLKWLILTVTSDNIYRNRNHNNE